MRLDFYVKPSCSLCEEAKDLLDDAQQTWGFELKTHNIMQDQTWFDRYRYLIPVVLIDGAQALTLDFNAAQLEAALMAAQPRSVSP